MTYATYEMVAELWKTVTIYGDGNDEATLRALLAERDAARELLRDFVSSLWLDGPGAADIVRADALAAVKAYLEGAAR